MLGGQYVTPPVVGWPGPLLTPLLFLLHSLTYVKTVMNSYLCQSAEVARASSGAKRKDMIRWTLLLDSRAVQYTTATLAVLRFFFSVK